MIVATREIALRTYVSEKSKEETSTPRGLSRGRHRRGKSWGLGQIPRSVYVAVQRRTPIVHRGRIICES